jgi:hypothetical protein
MKTPAHPPKKPANQGGKAAANVQPPNVNVTTVSNTANLPHQYSSTDNAWANHMAAKNHGGTRGSGKGTR